MKLNKSFLVLLAVTAFLGTSAVQPANAQGYYQYSGWYYNSPAPVRMVPVVTGWHYAWEVDEFGNYRWVMYAD